MKQDVDFLLEDGTKAEVKTATRFDEGFSLTILARNYYTGYEWQPCGVARSTADYMVVVFPNEKYMAKFKMADVKEFIKKLYVKQSKRNPNEQYVWLSKEIWSTLPHTKINY